MRKYSRIVPCLSGAQAVNPYDEMNDCTVRALANCTGKDYTECYTEMKNAGRKDKEGVPPFVWIPIYEKHGVECIAACGTTRMGMYMRRFAKHHCDGITVKRIIENISKDSANNDRLIIMTKNHVFAVVDGKICDKGCLNGAASVVAVFRLVKPI